MLESLLTKDAMVRREILEVILKTNDSILSNRVGFILEITSKIKSVDSFISGLILLNKNNYFGTYSLDYNRDIIQAVLEKKESKFLKLFMNPSSSQIFQNNNIDDKIRKEIDYYYNLEKLAYFYLYQKKFYDCFYEINLDNIQKLKSEIYNIKGISIDNKYFSNKNTISIKKGKDVIISDIVEIIFKIFQGVKINSKLDNFIRSNYSIEYHFIDSYLKSFNFQ